MIFQAFGAGELRGALFSSPLALAIAAARGRRDATCLLWEAEQEEQERKEAQHADLNAKVVGVVPDEHRWLVDDCRKEPWKF